MRQPEIYGHDTRDDIAGMLEDRALKLGLEIDMRPASFGQDAFDALRIGKGERPGRKRIEARTAPGKQYAASPGCSSTSPSATPRITS